MASNFIFQNIGKVRTSIKKITMNLHYCFINFKKSHLYVYKLHVLSLINICNQF